MAKKRRYVIVSSPLFRADAATFMEHFRDLFRPYVICAGEASRYRDVREPVYIVVREAERGEAPIPESEILLDPREALPTVPAGRRVWRRDRVRVRG